MNEYVQRSKAARRRVSELTLQQQNQILGIYRDAIAELGGRLQSPTARELDKYWMAGYRKALIETEKEMAKELRKNTKGAMGQAAEYGTDPQQEIMGDIIRGAGINTSEDSSKDFFMNVQKQVVENILGGNLYKDHKTLSRRIWNCTNKFGTNIQYVITKGLAEKKSAVELAADLEEFVKEPAKRGWDWQKVYPRIRNAPVDYNAVRLARTCINHAYQTATIQSCRINPFVEGIEWQAAVLAGRTCPLCMKRDGQIYLVDDVPLDHPNGHCTMLPYIPKSMQEVTDELHDWLNGGDNTALDTWFDIFGDYFAGVKTHLRRD